MKVYQGYKVIRTNCTHHIGACYATIYIIGRWVDAPTPVGGPLTVFGDLERAKQFARGLEKDHEWGIQIYDCEWIPWPYRLPRNSQNRSIGVWLRIGAGQIEAEYRSLPPGTKLAEWVRLNSLITVVQ